MQENQIINIEVDRAQATQFKRVLYHLFNKKGLTAAQRPGGYNIRIFPDKKMFSSGAADNSERVNTWAKHTKVVQTYRLLRANDIKALDDHITLCGSRYTLRMYIKSLTFPLNPKEGEDTKPLFLNVDYAAQGQDRQHGTVYLVATMDTIETAEKVMSILPCLVDRDINNTAATAWFHPGTQELINDITFNEDVSGNWDGTWTTPDDLYTASLLDEDMGVEFQFDENLLKELTHQNKTTPISANNLSFKSFGGMLGRTLPGNDEDASDTRGKAAASPPAESLAAPASAEGGSAK